MALRSALAASGLRAIEVNAARNCPVGHVKAARSGHGIGPIYGYVDLSAKAETSANAGLKYLTLTHISPLCAVSSPKTFSGPRRKASYALAFVQHS